MKIRPALYSALIVFLIGIPTGLFISYESVGDYDSVESATIGSYIFGLTWACALGGIYYLLWQIFDWRREKREFKGYFNNVNNISILEAPENTTLH